MKTNLLITAGAVLFFAIGCSQNSTKVAPKTDSVKVVGGDKDEHGCIHSAGYTWSAAKNNCIRIWEEGVRMEEVVIAPAVSSTSSSFVVFNADSSKVELFMPSSNNPILISKNENCKNCKSWSNDSLEITQNNGLTIKLRGKLVSQESKKKD
jgi:hypothetical protein